MIAGVMLSMLVKPKPQAFIRGDGDVELATGYLCDLL